MKLYEEEEMCSCFRSSPVLDKESSRREDIREEALSFSVSQQLKDKTVRIVHAGGRIEMYQDAIPVSKLIRKYPGMHIARPEVFKRPYESLLSADEILLPGNKYFVIRSTTVEKLQRRYARKGRKNNNNDKPAIREGPGLVSEEIEDVGDSFSEDSICSSARDFFVSKGDWSNCVVEKDVKQKRRFVPPIQKPRIWKEPDWEPSLTSIQELSP